MTDNLLVSGPFNVQHIPKVKTVGQLQHNLAASSSLSKSQHTAFISAKDKNNSFHSNSIVVCTHQFNAEYENELSCKPGDIFKLVDAKCVNGWILTMSITSGIKGWIPRDNIKVLDLQNSVPSEPVLPQRSAFRSIPKSNRNSALQPVSEVESCKTEISTESSLLDYYSQNTLSQSISTETNDSVYTPLIYNSIFVHSMYSLESSPSTFWYRIDLSSKLIATQKIHIARYYTDIFELNKKLQTHIKHSNLNLKLPKLPNSLGLDSNRDSVDLLSSNLSTLSNYLKNLLHVLDNLSSNSFLIKIFEKFCAPRDNDFQHYVDLNDDQILNILKPKSCSRNSVIELDFNTPFLKPSKTFGDDRTITSVSSSNSKSSIEHNTQSRSNSLKVKLLYKDEYLMIKVTLENLNFDILKNNISSKLNINGFTLAYRNEHNIFVLLRDDNGLQKALELYPRRLVVKVI
ncbi:hypothetical protein CANINC_005067 [Pichia inconspicua]|uniref:SH3 domain-containing protein n=1 Tax=Pichia inconspicua TaxID=52247 RepID=A0A4T0WW09_9ASCO|nr:hypothetical protein CANINC_005067 [[Candida] inconspicua]